MTYRVELNGKDVVVSHPNWISEPQVLASWTWHAELVRQLIAERDARIAEYESAAVTQGALLRQAVDELARLRGQKPVAIVRGTVVEWIGESVAAGAKLYAEGGR